MFNFKLLNRLCTWIGFPFENLWPFEFLESFRCSTLRFSIYYPPELEFRVKSYDNLNISRGFVVQFREPWYSIRRNRSSIWKVMNIWIPRELSFFNFESLDIVCAWIGLPCDNLWPLGFIESFRCSIPSFSIYYPPESEFRGKSYDNLNISRAFVVQFQASRYIMHLNQTSVWKVMTIWIPREPPLFNFKRLSILCAWIRLLCDKLWPFEFLESIRCSISSFSIYCAH